MNRISIEQFIRDEIRRSRMQLSDIVDPSKCVVTIRYAILVGDDRIKLCTSLGQIATKLLSQV